MASHDVVILTESRYLNPVAPGEYVRNILKEDSLVQLALESQGLSVTRKNWADPDFDWTQTNLALFRTTWDYFDHINTFLQWVRETSNKTKFINTPNLIQWNADKHYLGDLGNNGVRTIPTRYILKGSGLSLQEIQEMTGWKQTVVKPTIGGGGRYTYHITPENLPIVSDKLKPLMKEEDFMLQPFQYSVPDQGEWSFMIIGNQFSHAVLKKAKQGDFRVQDDFGGTVYEYEPTTQEIDFALKAVNACPESPAYARVDVILDNDGELSVSELELIEPEMWFRLKEEAANVLANEIVSKFYG